MSLYYSDKIKSTDSSKYGIVDATQISGHRHVKSITDLYLLPDTILSESGNNTNDDSLGQKWYVVDERADYELTSWEQRNNSLGWRQVDYTTQISELQRAVFGYSDDYVVAAWDPNSSSAEAIEILGSKSFADQWYPYLFDTTAVEEGKEALKPVGRLKKNNFFRFEDGSWAPAVCISEERRAECDVALYLDSSASTLYCEAGKFDAAKFHDEYGISQDLYTASGTKVNVLRPWETTETKYTIMVGRPDTVYLLDDAVGTSGKRWRGIFSKPTVWDGIDVSKYELKPTAISPCCSTTYSGKARNFFYLMKGESYCASNQGYGGGCKIFSNLNRTFPRANDVSQYTAATFSRSNNYGGNTNLSYPFAEGGWHAYNTFISSHEVLYGTKYLIGASRFSSGISSNNSCTSETTWLQNGGVRHRISGTDSWSYSTWGSSLPSAYKYRSDNTSTEHENFSSAINGYYPKEQCMESQIAASWATEHNIPEGQHFSMYDGEYWWNSVDGAKSLEADRMNCRVYKLMAGSMTCANSSGSIVNVDLEIVLRVGLMNGVNPSGDVFAYLGGGMEFVGTTEAANATGSTNGNSFPLKIWTQEDQKKWHAPMSSYYLDNLGKFSFETDGTYNLVYDGISPGTNSWAATKVNYTPWSITRGASSNTGECFYQWGYNYWGYSTVNRRTRIGCRLRGDAHLSVCSSRSLDSHHPAAATGYSCSFFAQILLEEA